MPPQKRARSEPAEPAPELTTSSTAGKKVSMTATLDAMPHCRTKAEVIAAIESHLVPSAHDEDDFRRLEVSRFPEKYRNLLNKATASLSTVAPTADAMMNNSGKSAWAFYAGGSGTDEESIINRDIPSIVYTIDLKFSTNVVITKVVLEGFTFGRTKLTLYAGKDEHELEAGCLGYGTDEGVDVVLPVKHAENFSSSQVYDVGRKELAEGSPDILSIATRGTMLAERCDVSESVVGRHFQLQETINPVNKNSATDRDVPSNLRWLLVRSRVTVEYEAVSAGAPGAPSFSRDLQALHADEALHDCVLRGTTPDGAVVEVTSCRCLLAARSEYFRALFFGPMGTTDRTVALGDIPSANALKTLVRYLASGSPGDCATLVEVVELYALAHRFSLFDFASAIITCIERLEDYSDEILPQKDENTEWTSPEILEAASRAAELLAAGCSTAFLTVLACSSQWRPIAQEESFRSFARAHPDLAAEFSGLLAKFLAKEGY